MDLDINKIYLEETKDYLIEFQKMILEITFDFMDINQENYDTRVNSLLKKIGEFFEVDRTYLFTLSHRNNSMVYSHEWCKTGVPPLVDINREIPLDIYPWWLDQLSENNIVLVEDVNLMPAEASVEQADLRKQDVKSIISIPINIDGKLEAYIGIDSVESIKKWTREEIELNHIMADILSKGMTQLNYTKKINFMLHHDPLTELPNRLLLTKELNSRLLEANFQETSC